MTKMEGNVKDEHKRDYCRRIKGKIMAGWGSSEINRWRKYNSLYCEIQKTGYGRINDEQLRDLDERLKYLRNLEEKKNTVIASIEEQGKMTPELLKKIEKAMTIVEVDDIYRPYRPKTKNKSHGS